MKVVLDWVLNHSGPVFEYKDGSKFGDAPKEIGEWTEELKPRELAAPEHFTRRGVIDDWDDPAQKNHGDFPPNYRHWASDNPDTAAKLIHVANWWIKETDIDGFRIDAVRHLAPGFLPKFAQGVKAYAKSLGKDNFFLVGENSTGYEDDLVPYLGPGKLDSLFQYASFRRDNKALHGAAPTMVLEASHTHATRVLGEAAGRMLRFFDNHDTYRFLRAGEPLARLHLALAYLIFSIGVPILYAGIEQAMRQSTGSLEPEGPHAPADPENREPMFDKADPLSATYAFVSRLLGLRAEHAALRRGEQWVRWSDPNAPGLFVFSRLHKGREVVVALNFGTQERQADPWVDRKATPAGTVLRDALDLNYRPTAYAAESGSKIHLTVPPLGVRVLVREP
jgi:glycosidase